MDMMNNSDTCGIRLMRLLDAQSIAIAKRELRNIDKMCLYSTGEYWVGFDHSAYHLYRLFPKSESFVVNHPNYPLAIVGVSVPASSISKYLQHRGAQVAESEYFECQLDKPFALSDYGDWHTKMVKSLR